MPLAVNSKKDGTNMLPIEDPKFIVDLELKFFRQELIEFLAYWHAKRGGRPFPSRKDIVPREIEKLLPWVNMYDIADQEGGDKEYRVRLMGTALSAALGGGDYGGKPVSELPQLLSKRIQRGINLVLETARPCAPMRLNPPFLGRTSRAMNPAWCPCQRTAPISI